MIKNKKINWLSLLVIILLVGQLYAYNVTGNIYTSGGNVMNAKITFTDEDNNSFSGITDSLGNFQMYVGTTAIDDNALTSSDFELEQNYPNPFAATTTIPYQLDKNSKVHVAIYDLLGRKVRMLEMAQKQLGAHQVIWDGRNDNGKRVATGMYFCQLQVGDQVKVRKIVFDENSSGMISFTGNYAANFSSNDFAEIQEIQSDLYSIKIENTDSTWPYINEKEITNYTLIQDTTLIVRMYEMPVGKVYVDSTHQLIRGFGAGNILQWRPDMTDAEIEKAFGTDDGQIGFSILRFRLQPQTSLWSTNLHSAKKAYDMGVTLFASPWNAPDDMLETVDGQRRVMHDKYADYAKHLDDFNTYMADNGAPLYAISIQNEPDYAHDWTGWTPDEMLTFCRDYAPAINNKIIAPESFQFRKDMSDPILNDDTACENVDIIGGHIYGGGLESYPLAEEKGKEIWMTEHLTGETDTDGSQIWSWALSCGKEMNDCMHAGFNAYVWWYIVRFYGPISDGEYNSGTKGDVTKKGFVMSQFARFIRPGFHRIQSNNLVQRNVNMSAYKNDDGKIVLVLINSSTAPIDQIVVFDQEMSMNFMPYVTTPSKNCERGDDIQVYDGKFKITLEGSSVLTLVSE